LSSSYASTAKSSITRLRAVELGGVPKVRALTEATYFAGLRKAGVPES
jgi:hypothetical protein